MANAGNKPSNGFTTEREVGGERRSIRHFHDGRVSSQREGPAGPVRPPNNPSLLSRTNSSKANSKAATPRIVNVPKFEDLKCDPATAVEIVQFCGDLDKILSQLPADQIPSDKDTNTISKQWEQMGGKDHTGDSDIHK
ncbi:hypothetical protein N7491_006456 [Penicillium cf. griseofulvum]|uniref:Uncharacterized protein n=1 Tax=Penicillium cf. griseofulvum TaxID=2972120 RepID=A0A9W9IX73_9EURO|nr:hypothetical protein N7472_010514 [Penicillium cf. griseofulvum]KAJ5429440.1 hypothetical protein N7491_006456 [Penicillium cf. griseofulvum]KAJ5436778.1 hypothetical protein N7445_007663 [Penicillium cf. griseofulvum]